MRFALLLMMVVSSAESAEPMLDGKTLKQWAALLSSGKPKDREEAAFALAEMGKTVPEAIPYLIRALKTGTSRSRMSAVEALGNLGTKAESAIPALKSLVLKTNSKKIRAQMLEVLHKISGASEKWTEERLNAFGLEVNEPQAILIAQLDLPKGQGLAVTQILEG